MAVSAEGGCESLQIGDGTVPVWLLLIVVFLPFHRLARLIRP